MATKSILLSLASVSAALAAGSVGMAYPDAPRFFGLMFAWISGACLATSASIVVASLRGG